MSRNSKPIEIFCSYSHKDNHEDYPIINKLKTYLMNFEESGLIKIWYDGDINPGSEWGVEIESHLDEADIILLFISIHFLESDYCVKEMDLAMENYEKGETRVIPIIISPCCWKELPIAKIQAIQQDGESIIEWSCEPETFSNISKSIYKIAKEISCKRTPPLSPCPTNHHLFPADHFQHRPELDKLYDFWKNDRGGLLALVGISGSGKTALIQHFLEHLPIIDNGVDGLEKYKSLPPPDALFVWSYSDKKDPTNCAAELYNYLTGKRTKNLDFSSISRILAQDWKNQRVLIILDALEQLQMAPDSKSEQEVNTSGKSTNEWSFIQDFLIWASEGKNPVYVIVTSRLELSDLSRYKDRERYNLLILNVDELTLEGAYEFLRSMGIKGPKKDFDDLFQEAGCHPQNLYLIGNALHLFCDDDVSRWREVLLDHKQALKFYEQKMSEEELAILQRLCLFQYIPLTKELLMDIFLGKDKEDIAGILSGHTNMEISSYLITLCNKYRLLHGDPPENPKSFKVHSAVKGYFYKIIKNKANLHKGISKYLPSLKSKIVQISDELTFTLEQIHHYSEAGCYKEAYEILLNAKINETNVWRVLYNSGRFGFLLSLTGKLVEAFEKKLWGANPEEKFNIYDMEGRIYRKYGKLRESQDAYQSAAEISESHDLPTRYKVEALQRLADTYHHMGDFDEEIKLLYMAAKLGGDLSEDEQKKLDFKAVTVGRTGRILMAWGSPSIAVELISKAIAYSNEAKHFDHICSETIERGDAYLTARCTEKALTDYNRALMIAKRDDWRGEASHGIGNCHLLMNDYKKAREGYNYALRIAEEDGYRWLEAKIGVTFSHLYLEEKDDDKAEIHAKRALEIADKCGYMVESNSAHLALAQAYFNKKEYETAYKHIKGAKEHIKITNHQWAKLELAKLEKIEIIPIIDKETMKMKEFAERKYAHENGLCHLTCILIAVNSEKKIVVQNRPKGKSYADRKDFFGGHVVFNDESIEIDSGQPVSFEELLLSTAIRETNEELRMSKNDEPFHVNEQSLVLLDKIGSFAYDSQNNVERSTTYLIKIPSDVSINPQDDINGQFIDVKTEVFSIDKLMEIYKQDPKQFADGAGRVLQRLATEPNLYESFIDLIERYL